MPLQKYISVKKWSDEFQIIPYNFQTHPLPGNNRVNSSHPVHLEADPSSSRLFTLREDSPFILTHMKNTCRFLLILIIAIVGFAVQLKAQTMTEPDGAYSFNQGSIRHILLFTEGYFVHAAYDEQAKSFKHSEGGLFKMKDGDLLVKMEFDTEHKENVDSIFTFTCKLTKESLDITYQGLQAKYIRIDNGDNPLAGAWRISGRMVDGKFSAIPPGSRKTIKILTGTRFQWIALDPKTKEYFGTGGGSYTYVNGKYTEKLEFFPRDNARVGSLLAFEDRVEDGEWYHTGKSSAGAPVFEIWKKASIIVE
ncbi:MAG: hypothetical protein ABI151_14435 [Chitinophagaceae bacterium]